MNDARTAAAIPRAHLSASPRLLTIHDVMERWNCSRSLIYKMIAAGKLRPVKLGRAVRFTETNVASLVAEE